VTRPRNNKGDGSPGSDVANAPDTTKSPGAAKASATAGASGSASANVPNATKASGTVKAPSTASMVIRLVVAAMFLGMTGPLLNTTAYPRMAEYFAIGRELSTLIGGIVFFAIAIIALRKPHLLDTRRCDGIAVVALMLCVVLLGLGLDGRSAVLTLLGLLARAIGFVWTATVFAVALLKLVDKRVVLGIVGAQSVVSNMMFLPLSAGMNAYVASALIALSALIPLVLVRTDAEQTLNAIADVPPDRANVIEGLGGVQTLVKLCMCMLLMGVGSGFALTFNEQGNSPQVSYIDCVLVVLVVGVIVAFEPWDREKDAALFASRKAARQLRKRVEGTEAKAGANAEATTGAGLRSGAGVGADAGVGTGTRAGSGNGARVGTGAEAGTGAGNSTEPRRWRIHLADDTLFTVAFLCLLAGSLLALVSFSRPIAATNVLIRLARDCFDMMLWLIIYSIGRRNVFSLLPVFGFVRGTGSLGTMIGASGGHIVNDTMLHDLFGAQCIIAGFIFVGFALVWLFFRDFSVGNLIVGVQKVSEQEARVRGASYLDERCHSIGEAYGLTPREVEILGQLARGRDGKFIQQEYVLSYNTVKTHIKHIYTKLDVHSRQELLDLIEGEDARS
jgi:DNA-binding CsgD family transcriptional regulator